MTTLPTRIAVRLIRAWTRIYTSGLPADARDRRRAEIESDVWESTRAVDGASTSRQMLFRLLLGIRDDLAWRASVVRPSAISRAAVIALAAATLAAALLMANWAATPGLPAPMPVAHQARAMPPPPPPPPPPCEPPGLGRKSPSPCK